MKIKAPQLIIFSSDNEPAADTTLYILTALHKNKTLHYFSGHHSFDALSFFIRENNISGIVEHQATDSKTSCRDGKILNLRNFPVINNFLAAKVDPS